jgi:hypothetical protein
MGKTAWKKHKENNHEKINSKKLVMQNQKLKKELIKT